MKNGIFKYSLLAGAMAFSGLVMANPSATLAVKGQVSTGTCTAAVLPTANIDLGNISADSLPPTGSLEALGKTNYLRITCTSPLKYQVSLTDNRADSAIPAAETSQGAAFEGRVLGLGKTSDNVNIGGYYISLQNITTKFGGTDYQDMLSRSAASGASWTKAPAGVAITPLNNKAGSTDRAYVAMAASGSLEPEASATAEFRFMTSAYISSALRDITDQQTIDGNVTFNVDYL
ncbi:DUF1120 domain-containing protein [Enterobacter sp. RHBSTW-00175]|uniref:DUF1120 domain-containing protein n=1 Tax=Enterobacter sp. RHBSTW-00175 TaxID=2742639 RepID=UPI0015EA5E09|nr:DUF1120 domain-containing protein [Enterobacter sp. RHBSTW-00175]QMR75416.1 DUF1120 domain-containing protein [Enterobacter sp. RHBSTW-00175]